MSHNISLLLKQNNLEVTQQPYDLQMAEADSKLILSMSLNVRFFKTCVHVHIKRVLCYIYAIISKRRF